eukprot:scaffold7595_cov267-Pinguiococcus_pyrenoidosus.AAC.15
MEHREDLLRVDVVLRQQLLVEAVRGQHVKRVVRMANDRGNRRHLQLESRDGPCVRRGARAAPRMRHGGRRAAEISTVAFPAR